jgi:hypothetical protein
MTALEAIDAGKPVDRALVHKLFALGFAIDRSSTLRVSAPGGAYAGALEMTARGRAFMAQAAEVPAPAPPRKAGSRRRPVKPSAPAARPTR